MRIEIDTELLCTLDISPDEFVYLEALRLGEHIQTPPLNLMQIDPERIERLGLIKIGVDNEIHIRDKYLSTVASDFDTMFAELVGAYPFKVGNVGDMRVLRAHDPKAKANETAKKRYKAAVGNNLPLHKKVLKLLDIQLTNMRGKLQYLPALEVWINKREWEKWEGTDKEEDGEGRITRVLD
jgi:hypothetical protein